MMLTGGLPWAGPVPICRKRIPRHMEIEYIKQLASRWNFVRKRRVSRPRLWEVSIKPETRSLAC